MYFLIIAWKFSGVPECTCPSAEDCRMDTHQTVIIHEREEEVLPHSFNGYSLQLHPDKQMKIKRTDHPYSEDASWVMMLASWLLRSSGTLPFPLLL